MKFDFIQVVSETGNPYSLSARARKKEMCNDLCWFKTTYRGGKRTQPWSEQEQRSPNPEHRFMSCTLSS